MKTLVDEWESRQNEVLPHDAPDIQVTETKRAFYAGARSLLHLMQIAGSKRHIEAMEFIESVNRELNEFVHNTTTP